MHDYHTRIRQLMTVRNVTQAGMIRSTGIPRATITRLLNGESEVSINQMEQAVKSERETAKAKGQTQQKKDKS